MLQENVQLRTANNQKEIEDVRAEIEAVVKEAKDRSAEIQKKTKLPAEAHLNTLATTEGNVVAVPHGFIAHANDVNSQEMADVMQGNLAGVGLEPEVAANLAKLMAQTSLNFIQSKSIHVGAPTASLPAGSAQAPTEVATEGTQQQPQPQQQLQQEEDAAMTDLELSEEELEAAQVSAKEGEVVRKTRRATKDEKAKVSSARTAKKVAGKHNKN